MRNVMWATPLELWDEWLIVLACAVTAFCCLLHLNGMGRGWTRVVEKAITYVVGFGACGMLLGPFCGFFSTPSVFELTFTWGTALFAIFLTQGHWMELPLLNRRHTAHRVDIPQREERRGVPTEEEEEDLRACSH